MQQAINHINYAIVTKLHPPMYLMHKYWARKPHNVVREYVERYSKQGEIVLDPFCGSGVTVIEALKAGRKAIGVDLDPVSIFITRMTGSFINLKDLEISFNTLEKSVKSKVLELYETKCTKCKKVAHIQQLIFKNSKPVKIFFKCENCRTKDSKIYSLNDKKNAVAIDNMKIPYWYPSQELIWNTRVNVHKGMKVSDLFSKRNLVALSIVYNSIVKIKDRKIREMIKFIFSSLLPQASKLLVHTPGQGPGWKIRGFWIPENRYEMNVWHYFENRYKKLVLGKKESNEVVGDKFNEEETVWLYNKSATDLSFIPGNSIDYIFTDPPYGDSVPYLELNYMWALWLQFKVNFDDEIIVSDSPARPEKNTDMYSKMMALAFREMFRVLKPNRFLTVTFHNTDIQIYNIIIKGAIVAGFELEKIIYQRPAKVSSKAKLAPYGSAEGDYYIRFSKPFRLRGYVDESEMDKVRYEKIVIESVKKILAERGEPTPYPIIINGYSDIYEKLKEYGFIFSAPERIENILKSRLDREFVIVDNKWWFKDPTQYHFDIVPLRERVEKAVINVLNRKIKVSFDDIFQEILMNFPNSMTPEVDEIIEVLPQYAKKTPEGKWMLKTDVRVRESEHDKIVEILSNLGIRLGFKVHADLEGWREGALPLRLAQENLKRVLEIDVIWYKENQIYYEFEVENSTGITEALVRGSNIPSGVIKRFIVIPEEREALLTRKVNEPMINERISSDNWNFIRYDALRDFYISNKNGKVKLMKLEALAQMPNIKQHRQSNVDEYV